MKSISPQFKNNQKYQKKIVFQNSYINEKTNKKYPQHLKHYGRLHTQGSQIVQKNCPQSGKNNQYFLGNAAKGKIKKDFSVGNFFILNPNQSKKCYVQKQNHQSIKNHSGKNNQIQQKLFCEGIYQKKDFLKQDRVSHKIFHNRASFKFNENLNNKSYLQKKSITNFKGVNTFGLNRNTQLNGNNSQECQRNIEFRYTYLNPDLEQQQKDWHKESKTRTSNKQNSSIAQKNNQKISIKKQKSKKYVANFNFTSFQNFEPSKYKKINTQTNQDNNQLKIVKQVISTETTYNKPQNLLQDIQNQDKNSKKKKIIESNWLKKKYYQVKTEPCETSFIKEKSNKIFDWKNVLIFQQKIGQGTFGKVYVAKRKDNGQIFAVKKVLIDKKYKSRQLQIATSLDSKFVMKVYGVFTTIQKKQEFLNIVMQYYPQNLYERINSEIKPKLSSLQQKILIYQMIKGLSYIHSKNICHRDIKPHNMLVHNWKLVLCDFGSAKILVKGQANLSYICSRCYRAPQLIFGSTQYTTQIDMWALGCVILELINHIPLFIGENSLDHLLEVIKILGTPTKQQVLEMNPNYDISDYQMPLLKRKNLLKLFPQCDTNLMDLINKLLTYSPKERLTAIQALTHKYFDQIRQKQTFEKIKKHLSKDKLMQIQTFENQFFKFEQKQFKQKNISRSKLVPTWYKR